MYVRKFLCVCVYVCVCVLFCAAGVSSTLLLLIAMFAPVTTVISKRWGASTAMVAGALLCSVANILASFAENIGVLYITYGVMLGAGSSLSYTAVLCELPA